MNLARRAVAEFIGTAMLLAVVVGSGIMGERLAGGHAAIVLLANSLATGAGLAALILSFAPVSGAQFNPLVTLALVLTRQFPREEVPLYLLAQTAGAVTGVWAAHLMFGEPLLQLSQHARPGEALLVSEFIASFGLLWIILSSLRYRPAQIPLAVAAYITAAYWFTASTSFANPAVTLARTLTDTFCGIRAADGPGFIAAQLLGAVVAVRFDAWLHVEAKPLLDAQ